MINFVKPKYTFPIICTLGAVTITSISLLVEYRLGIKPCRLCQLQRIPYAFIALLGPLLFVSKIKKIGLSAIFLTLLASIVLATYHLLVISGLVQDPCSVPSNIRTISDFQMLLEAPPPCSVVGWKLLRLPISAYNLMLATGSFIFISYLGIKKKIW